jgi:hypothetical protein
VLVWYGVEKGEKGRLLGTESGRGLGEGGKRGLFGGIGRTEGGGRLEVVMKLSHPLKHRDLL